jgi:hypothetical protein
VADVAPASFGSVAIPGVGPGLALSRPLREHPACAPTARVRLPRPPMEDLPMRQVVVIDGPHPPVQLVTIAATLERGWSSPAVPSACP